MRLSNRQYKFFVRFGIGIVILVVLAFDRVPPGYQPALLMLSILGAAIGFFPLATSRPFESDKSDDSSQTEPIRRSDAVPVVMHEVQSALQNRAIKILAESVRRDLIKLSREQKLYNRYYQELAQPTLRSYVTALAQSRDERQDRVREVHDLIDRLRGIPQKFSVQLTSDNTIVVNCDSEHESPSRAVELEANALAQRASATLNGQYVN